MKLEKWNKKYVELFVTLSIYQPNILACKNWEESVNKFGAKTPFSGFWREVADFSKSYIQRHVIKIKIF